MDDLYKYNNRAKPERRRGADRATKKLRNGRNDPLKIVYISSPMKVKTCESKFRSLVQELTGKDSQVAMFMEMSNSHAREVNTSQLLMSNSRPQEVDVVEEKLLSPRYVMDESFEVGSCGWETELPWHLLE